MTGQVLPDRIRFGADGLVPAIVQDAADGRILMQAWMDPEAVEATLRTGEVHFHSRSRGRLWRKGETSGNVLRLRSIAVDCDGDALLVTVDPVGPTCHRGSRSCFDPPPSGTADEGGVAGAASADGARPEAAPPEAGLAWLEVLWATIEGRARDLPEGSYTARLLEGGASVVGRKVTEEATEVLLAARDDAEAERSGGSRTATRRALAEESADLLYHLLVLAAERGISPSDVVAVLRRRHEEAP
jgi:phosphoribosyl-ATP pyrophosphohydrolase/phosphoribosyl-AMP cyclohydrolase